MILTVDVGNTHTNFSIFEKDKVILSWHLATQKHVTTDKYATHILKVFRENKVPIQKIKGVAISSVVPHLIQKLTNLSVRFLDLHPIIISYDLDKLGFDILIDAPETVGADLLADVMAVNTLYSTPALIIDFGTVTTLIQTDDDGNFLGGSFLPGLKLMHDSLSSGADQLTQFKIERPPSVIATTTETAMQSGVVYGYIDMINGLIQRFFKARGGECPVIITGGFSSFFAEYLSPQCIYDPDLTMKGIYIAYKKHINKEK